MIARVQPARRWAIGFAAGTDRSRRDWLVIALLLLVATAMYLPASLAGHPVLPGDDLTQNFPLRVLSGQILASGRLPAWDPFIWSGTPLLAGWNAGAMFPGTWLFAFLPAIFAWTINLIAVPFFASSGVYVLLRKLDCRAVAALLGALVFTYTGFMSGQVVHLGLTEGTACMPWMLVGLEGLTKAVGRPKIAAYAMLLSVAVALNILAADPRAISNASIAVLVYLLACCLRARRAAVALLVRAALAALVGLALSAIQWLPGLGFLHSSQRSANLYDFFGGGSIGPRHLATLLTVPFLLGANGNFGLPVYNGSYNLPELTVGVGFLALVAALCYLPGVLGSLCNWMGLSGFCSRFSLSKRRLGVWYVLLILGIILTLGVSTPVAHLLVHLPFYGGERLQNRNAVLFDLALCVLLGFFVDDLLDPARRIAGSNRFLAYPLDQPLNRWLGLLPMLGALALIAIAYAEPLKVENDLHVPYPFAQMFDVYRGYLIATAILAALIAALVCLAGRLSFSFGRATLVALVLCDVGIYVANGDYASVPSSVLASSNQLSSAVRHYSGVDGRFAIYNPALELNDPSDPRLFQAGVSDLNVLQQNPSVQGYGSIVNGIYENATSTHDYEDLNVGRLAGVSFNTLDLRALLTLPLYFGEPLQAHQLIPLANGEAIGSNGALVSPASPLALPPNASGPWPLSSGRSFVFTLPTPTRLVRASIVLIANGTAPKSLIVQAIDQGQTRQFSVAVKRHLALVSFPQGGEVLSSLKVLNASPASIDVGAVVVVTSQPRTRLLLDGALQGTLLPPHWRYAGRVGPLVVYLNSETAGLAWLQPARDTTPNADDLTSGTVVVQSSPAQGQRMVVDSPADAILARSEGYSNGWSARLTPIGGGPTKVLPVHRFGLIQSIDIPKGRYELTWTYAPRDILIGFWVTIIGVIALLALLGFVCANRPWRAR